MAMFTGHDDLPADAGKRHFATTHWSVVLAAGDRNALAAQGALAALCEQYWYPLYVYVRRRVTNVEEAQDLTQAFFAHLIEKQVIARANRDRGRFRSFLLASLKNFLDNEWNKARAEKRGGGKPVLSLDFDSGESRYQIEPAHEMTPEKLYERRWVLTLIDQVLALLQMELADEGKAQHFKYFKKSLIGSATAAEYEFAAKELGITPAAAKQAAYRMRRRYRQLFRDEVARTVADDADVEDEIRRLLRAIGE
ncbi:MAG: RNA polymerase sigma factor [Aeoliella sp.]